MNTDMTGFRWFSKPLCPCALDESSLNMERVKLSIELEESSFSIGRVKIMKILPQFYDHS